MTGDFEGAFDVDITLNGQGESLASLMAGLDGDLIIILGESKVPIEYLNFLGNTIGADFGSHLIFCPKVEGDVGVHPGLHDRWTHGFGDVIHRA